MQRFQDDQDAWIAIVTGAGKAFDPGADRKEGGSAGSWVGTFSEIPTVTLFQIGLEAWKPTIAATASVSGYGLTGARTCYVPIAAESAEFGFEEVRRGNSSAQRCHSLAVQIGWQLAMELLLTAT